MTTAPAAWRGPVTQGLLRVQAGNSPPLTAATNDDQPFAEKVSAGPLGSLLSRTGTAPGMLAATSMQSPPLSL